MCLNLVPNPADVLRQTGNELRRPGIAPEVLTQTSLIAQSVTVIEDGEARGQPGFYRVRDTAALARSNRRVASPSATASVNSKIASSRTPAARRTPECANLIMDNLDAWAAWYEANG